jgi:hypothetical protein
LRAREITIEPVVSDTISSDWRIGTPEESRVPRLRAKRARASLAKRLPKTGSLSFNGSTTLRTCSVLPYFRHRMSPTIPSTVMIGMTYFIVEERKTRTWVGSGSSPPSSRNIPSKTGTMKTSMPMHMMIARMNTTTG